MASRGIKRALHRNLERRIMEKPIETCPKPLFDPEKWYVAGPKYLLWDGRWVIGSYEYTEKGKGRWVANGRVIHPTHWEFLPPDVKVK